MMSVHRSHDRFATTRWSMVLHPSATESTDARKALVELAQRYWYPVYAYVRRCGHAPEIAQDVTRCFLACLMRQFSQDRAPPQHHFRRFLLDQLNAFLGGDWREIVDSSVPGELAAPPDLEARYQRDNLHANSPDQAYQHSFALEVIGRALRRLHAEAQQTGHLAMLRLLEPYLARDPGPGEYEALAAQLQSRPLALVVALKRLRQRFRELVGSELADTVTSESDLVVEQSALHAVLCERQAPP